MSVDIFNVNSPEKRKAHQYLRLEIAHKLGPKHVQHR